MQARATRARMKRPTRGAEFRCDPAWNTDGWGRSASSTKLSERGPGRKTIEFWPYDDPCCILSGVNLLLERLVPLGMLVVAAVSVPIMLLSPTGLTRLEALRNQREALGLDMARLEREIERLRHRAESIKTSPRSVERVARDELGLVRRTELVMHFKQE